MTRGIALALTTFTTWVLLAPAALAQAGESVGENVGELLSGWASSLFTGVVAIIAIVFLMSRKFAELAVFLGIAVVVGGLVLAPDSAAAAMKGLFQAVVGS